MLGKNIKCKIQFGKLFRFVYIGNVWHIIKLSQMMTAVQFLFLFFALAIVVYPEYNQINVSKSIMFSSFQIMSISTKYVCTPMIDY